MRKAINIILISIALILFGGMHMNVGNIDEIDMIKFHAYGCMKRHGLTIGEIRDGEVDCAFPFKFVPRGLILKITREQARVACRNTFKDTETDKPYDVGKFDVKNDIWTCVKFPTI